MHLRKSRKAKVAATAFVKSVIRGQNTGNSGATSVPSAQQAPHKQVTKTQAQRSGSRSPGRGSPASSGSPARSSSPGHSRQTLTKQLVRQVSKSPSRSTKSPASDVSKSPKAKEATKSPKSKERTQSPSRSRESEDKSSKASSSKPDGEDQADCPPKRKRGRPRKYSPDVEIKKGAKLKQIVKPTKGSPGKSTIIEKESLIAKETRDEEEKTEEKTIKSSSRSPAPKISFVTTDSMPSSDSTSKVTIQSISAEKQEEASNSPMISPRREVYRMTLKPQKKKTTDPAFKSSAIYKSATYFSVPITTSPPGVTSGIIPDTEIKTEPATEPDDEPDIDSYARLMPFITIKDENWNLSHPGDHMTKTNYLKLFGLADKSELKKLENTSRMHRAAGGKLRRIIKPRVANEMVYGNFLRSGILDNVADEWSSSDDDASSPRVSDKDQVLSHEESKKRSLSPKIHDKYSRHCGKVALISMHKVAKSASAPTTPERKAMLGEGSGLDVGKLGKTHSFKENEPPSLQRKLDFDCMTPAQIAALDAIDAVPGPSKPKKREWLKPPVKSPKEGTAKEKHHKKNKDKKPQLQKQKSNKSDNCSVKPKLGKSKSFEGKSTGQKVKKLQTKSKSFDPKNKPKSDEKPNLLLVKEEDEDDDPSRRRSARQRNTGRKAWWHLLRAAPDEYEEDKKWEEEEDKKEKKKQAKMDRVDRERAESEERRLEEEAWAAVEEEMQKKEAAKLNAANETVVPKKKKKKKKKLQEGAENMKDNNEKGLTKRKSLEDGASQGGKKIKTDVLKSERDKEDEKMEEDFQKKLKRNLESDGYDVRQDTLNESLITAEVEGESRAIMILGDDGEPLSPSEHTAMYSQLKGVLEHIAKQADKLTGGVIELSIRKPPSNQDRETTESTEVPAGETGYMSKELECVTPHMCATCWVNDHMYCRNMKRIARDLIPTGGCLHYIPCPHYRYIRQAMSEECASRRGTNMASIDGRGVKYIMREMPHSVHSLSSKAMSSVTISDGKLMPKTEASAMEVDVPNPLSATPTPAEDQEASKKMPETGEDLICNETLQESDSEPNSPEAPKGTELLKVQLKARAGQIAHSLGLDDSKGRMSQREVNAKVGEAPPTPGQEAEMVGDAEWTREVVVEDHAEEVVIGKVEETEEVDELFVPLPTFTPTHQSSQAVTKREHSSHNAETPKDEERISVRIVPYPNGDNKEEFVYIRGKRHRVVKVQVQKSNSHDTLAQHKRKNQGPRFSGDVSYDDDSNSSNHPNFRLTISVDGYTFEKEDSHKKVPGSDLSPGGSVVAYRGRSGMTSGASPLEEVCRKCNLPISGGPQEHSVKIEIDDVESKTVKLLKSVCTCGCSTPLAAPRLGYFGGRPRKPFALSAENLRRLQETSQSGAMKRNASAEERELCRDSGALSPYSPEGSAQQRSPASSEPIKITSTETHVPIGLQTQVTASKDGSQVLSFTTKDIREGKPELMEYIKKANLSSIIKNTLEAEKSSLQKAIRNGDRTIGEMKECVEQSRCLVAAVQSEIQVVKDQLVAMQKAVLEEEAKGAKMRINGNNLDKKRQSVNHRLEVCTKAMQNLDREYDKEPDKRPAFLTDRAKTRHIGIPAVKSVVGNTLTTEVTLAKAMQSTAGGGKDSTRGLTPAVAAASPIISSMIQPSAAVSHAVPHGNAPALTSVVSAAPTAIMTLKAPQMSHVTCSTSNLSQARMISPGVTPTQISGPVPAQQLPLAATLGLKGVTPENVAALAKRAQQVVLKSQQSGEVVGILKGKTLYTCGPAFTHKDMIANLSSLNLGPGSQLKPEMLKMVSKESVQLMASNPDAHFIASDISEGLDIGMDHKQKVKEMIMKKRGSTDSGMAQTMLHGVEKIMPAQMTQSINSPAIQTLLNAGTAPPVGATQIAPTGVSTVAMGLPISSPSVVSQITQKEVSPQTLSGQKGSTVYQLQPAQSYSETGSHNTEQTTTSSKAEVTNPATPRSIYQVRAKLSPAALARAGIIVSQGKFIIPRDQLITLQGLTGQKTLSLQSTTSQHGVVLQSSSATLGANLQASSSLQGVNLQAVPPSQDLTVQTAKVSQVEHIQRGTSAQVANLQAPVPQAVSLQGIPVSQVSSMQMPTVSQGVSLQAGSTVLGGVSQDSTAQIQTVDSGPMPQKISQLKTQQGIILPKEYRYKLNTAMAAVSHSGQSRSSNSAAWGVTHLGNIPSSQILQSPRGGGHYVPQVAPVSKQDNTLQGSMVRQEADVIPKQQQQQQSGTLQALQGGKLQIQQGSIFQVQQDGTLKSVPGGMLQSLQAGMLQVQQVASLQSQQGGTLQALQTGVLQIQQSGTPQAPPPPQSDTLQTQQDVLQGLQSSPQEGQQAGSLPIQQGTTLLSNQAVMLPQNMLPQNVLLVPSGSAPNQLSVNTSALSQSVSPKLIQQTPEIRVTAPAVTQLTYSLPQVSQPNQTVPGQRVSQVTQLIQSMPQLSPQGGQEGLLSNPSSMPQLSPQGQLNQLSHQVVSQQLGHMNQQQIMSQQTQMPAASTHKLVMTQTGSQTLLQPQLLHVTGAKAPGQGNAPIMTLETLQKILASQNTSGQGVSGQFSNTKVVTHLLPDSNNLPIRSLQVEENKQSVAYAHYAVGAENEVQSINPAKVVAEPIPQAVPLSLGSDQAEYNADEQPEMIIGQSDYVITNDDIAQQVIMTDTDIISGEQIIQERVLPPGGEQIQETILPSGVEQVIQETVLLPVGQHALSPMGQHLIEETVLPPVGAQIMEQTVLPPVGAQIIEQTVLPSVGAQIIEEAMDIDANDSVTDMDAIESFVTSAHGLEFF